MPAWALWLILAAVLVAAEVATTAFYAILFAAAALAAALVAALTSSLPAQLATFLLAGTAAVLTVRPVLERWARPRERRPSAVQALPGRRGVVVKRVAWNEYGLVKVGGDIWTATTEEPESIPEGVEVLVLGVDGVKLIVTGLDGTEHT